jgi:hypothetical protein
LYAGLLKKSKQKLEIKDTTYIARSASYLDLHIKIESEDLLRMKLPKR